MTAQEVKLEILCYQRTFNPVCDIYHLTLEEIAEFISLQKKVEDYLKPAPILRMFK